MPDVDRTCLSYWFPLIRNAGLPAPKTEIIRTDCELCHLLDGTEPPGFAQFLNELRGMADRIGYPCFLRTGHTSNKHDWRDACYVQQPEDLSQHVFNLEEFSACCDFMGLPTDVWVVRELVPTTPVFHAFPGAMPIVREFRVFTRGGEVTCIHPYWPPDCIRSPSIDDWRPWLRRISEIDARTNMHLGELALTAAWATAYSDWSVDFLQDVDGNWWLTDMAEAARSYHWPGCKFATKEIPV